MEHQNSFEKSLEGLTKSTTRVLSESEKLFEHQLRANRRRLGRYRLLVGVLGTIGFVALTNGLWLIIIALPALYNNPLVLIGIGFFLLFVSGSLYNRLLGR